MYSKRGCYITDFELDAEGIQLDPALIPQLDPVFHLALHASREALRDANLAGFDHSRTGVIIGNIALPTEKTSAITAEILGRKFEEQVLSSFQQERKAVLCEEGKHEFALQAYNPSAEPLCGGHGGRNDRQSV